MRDVAEGVYIGDTTPSRRIEEGELAQDGKGMLTGLRLHEGENWQVMPDLKPAGESEPDGMVYASMAVHRCGARVPAATLRRVGWLDQRGRVWTRIPPGAVADEHRCGSFTPLLIDPGERDGT